MLSKESTDILFSSFYQFFNKYKLIALDPIRTDEKNLYIYGKPAVGLVQGLAIAFIYQSFDIHNLNNIGFDASKKLIKTIITKEMVMTELKPLLEQNNNDPSIPTNTNFTGSIWNWRKILTVTQENSKDFEIWCIQTLHNLKYFPTQCAEFICALHNHPIDSKLKPYIEQIVSAPVTERIAIIDALSIDTLYPKPSSENSCTIS